MIWSTFMFRVELGMTIETHWNCWGLLAKEESRRALEESRLAKEESERVKAGGRRWVETSTFQKQHGGPYFSRICKVKNGENAWICPSIPFFSSKTLNHSKPWPIFAKSSHFPLRLWFFSIWGKALRSKFVCGVNSIGRQWFDFWRVGRISWPGKGKVLPQLLPFMKISTNFWETLDLATPKSSRTSHCTFPKDDALKINDADENPLSSEGSFHKIFHQPGVKVAKAVKVTLRIYDENFCSSVFFSLSFKKWC